MSSQNDQTHPRSPGRFWGLPYDWRRPTAARVRERAWNPGDPRLLTPKTYGWGLGVNLYWLCHPVRFARARRDR